MATPKKLTRRQLALIEDLFAGESEEQEVLDRHKVSRNTFNKWLSDQRFIEQFNNRIAQAYHQSELIIARYARLAALKLIELTESDKDETARKACLDIISRQPNTTSHERQATSDELAASGLTPETATKILEVLAKESDRKEK